MNILIVEDQAAIRSSLRSYVETALPESHIVEAGSVATALRAARTHELNLVLMDVLLPDGNGIELTRQLKALKPQVPVIVVSLLSGQTYVELAREAGAQAYVLKDRLLADLLPAIAEALAFPRGAAREG